MIWTTTSTSFQFPAMVESFHGH